MRPEGRLLTLEAMENDGVLAGETAIVTGAGRGIGRAVALAFARAGATVVLAARTAEQLDETRREVETVGGGAVTVPADITRRADVEALVATALAETGRLDIVVNNAGVFVWKALADLDEPEWDRILDTNLKSSYLLIHAALPALMSSGRGRIINVASIHGTIGDANVVAHCAAKFGLIGLTKALASELRGAGITVNALCPGSTDNKSREVSPPKREFPLKEKLRAEDVAEAALFLASPAAATISGAVLDIWGGTYVTIKG
jgi:3-oxoacyl-[acyl-carrier protein] reductase